MANKSDKEIERKWKYEEVLFRTFYPVGIALMALGFHLGTFGLVILGVVNFSLGCWYGICFCTTFRKEM